MNRHMIRLAALACTALAPGATLAHTGVHDHGGFFNGLMHPLLGVDHMLALLAIGLWAASVPIRHRALPALVFLPAMGAGAIVALQGMSLPGIETGIAVSVLVGGLLLMSFTRLSPLNSTVLIALFAVFHGQAHGLEIPASGASVLYMAGLLVTSALVLLVAMRTGGWLCRNRAEWSLRGAGLLSSAFGVWLLSGV